MLKLYYSKDNKYIIAELYNKYNKITVEYAENIAILKQKILYKLVNPKPNNNTYKYFWKLFYDKIKNITEKEFNDRLEENMKDNKNIYIEIAGMLRDNESNYYNNIPIMENSKRRENYRLKLNKKEQMLKENNLEYYIILPSDMKNMDKLFDYIGIINK